MRATAAQDYTFMLRVYRNQDIRHTHIDTQQEIL